MKVRRYIKRQLRKEVREVSMKKIQQKNNSKEYEEREGIEKEFFVERNEILMKNKKIKRGKKRRRDDD